MVRHAESATNARRINDDNSRSGIPGPGLSQRGRRQARALARRLSRYRFDAVIVSPLCRTRQTIGPYLEGRNVGVLVSRLAVERCVGIFAGKPYGSITEYCNAHGLDRLEFRPRGGESLRDVYARAARFLSYVKRRFNGRSVLLVGHGSFLRCLDMAARGADVSGFSRTRPLGNAEIREYDI